MAESADRDPARRVTLADVAERAGVSKALASIVLRDAPGAAEGTRQRVRASARELGYQPLDRAPRGGQPGRDESGMEPFDTGWQSGRRATLRDVAARANVSKALASIVMRDAPGASASTRERVLAAARELRFRPDLRARSLASQTSKLIGVMFSVDLGSFHFDLLESLYAAASDHGHSLILTPVTRRRDEAAAAESLRDFRFEGLIMLGPATEKPLLTGQVPLVTVGWWVEHAEVDVVRTSDELGMAAAVDHLVGLGHREIAHIDGGDDLIAASRREAFISAMGRAGLSREARLEPGGHTQLDGQRAARRMVESGALPSAVIAFNDDVAAAAMGLFAQQGIEVPPRLSVVGWDDSEAAALSPVGLTSVVQHPDLMGRLAVERIVARIEQRRVHGREILLEPELRVRESTARPWR